MEAVGVVGREKEPIRAERVAVDLTEIVGHLAGPRVGILELQDGLLNFAGGRAHLDGAAVVGRGEGLGIRARLGGEGIFWGASWGVLPANVEVHGEVAVVANVGVTSRTSYLVEVCGDGIAAVWYGWGVRGSGWVLNVGLAGWNCSG